MGWERITFAPTGANINHLHKHWPDAKWEEDAQPVLDKYIQSLKEANQTHKQKIMILLIRMIFLLKLSLMTISAKHFIYQETKSLLLF